MTEKIPSHFALFVSYWEILLHYMNLEVTDQCEQLICLYCDVFITFYFEQIFSSGEIFVLNIMTTDLLTFINQ